MFIQLLLYLMISTLTKCQDQEAEGNEIIWTTAEESEILTEEEHKIAFRDVVLEDVLRRFFNVLISNSERGAFYSRVPSQILIPDPVYVPDIAFSRAQGGLYDIHFQAKNIEASGLLNTVLKNNHVLRHVGLNDIRVVLQMVTDLHLTGDYTLSGTGLSLLPLTGNGSMTVEFKGMMVTLESFVVSRNNQLFFREVDLKMTDSDLDINLENLMGDGLLGNVANSVLNTVGEDILFSNRDALANMVRNHVKNHVQNFLNPLEKF